MAFEFGIEYPYNSGVPSTLNQFPVGADIGILIKGMGDVKTFTVSIVYDNPAAVSFYQEGTASIMGNGNIEVTLPNVVTHGIVTVSTPGLFGNLETITANIGVGEKSLPPASSKTPNWYLVGGLALGGAILVGVVVRKYVIK
jgi:hypothetical protein